MKDFIVCHFNDYHQIEDQLFGYKKFIELGCFPVRKFGYCRYFALYYNSIPSFDKIMEELMKQVSCGEFIHGRTGEDIGISKTELEYEVKESLKSYLLI